MQTGKYSYYNGKAIPDGDRLRRVEKLAGWLDAKWSLPGTDMRIGLDGIIGLIPGIGDSIGAVISSYIIYEAHQLGVPLHIKIRMLWNVFVDWLVGLIPLVGDLFDIGWKANLKNVNLLREYLAKRG